MGSVGGESALFGDLRFEPCEHRVEAVGEFAELILVALQRIRWESDPCAAMRVASVILVKEQHPSGEEPPSEETEHEQQRQRLGGPRSERIQQVGPGGREGPRGRSARVGNVAKEEQPHGGEEQAAREHEEPGIAEGELEANAHSGRPIHARPPRFRGPVPCRCGSRRRRPWHDPGLAESLAQGRDRDANGVGERVGVLVPCSFEALRRCDTAFGGDEHLEHGELLPGQRDATGRPGRPRGETDRAAALDLPHRRSVVRAPSVECSEPQHELLQVERLGEVVVGTELETEAFSSIRSAAVSMRIGMPLPDATMLSAISSRGPGMSRSRTAMS